MGENCVQVVLQKRGSAENVLTLSGRENNRIPRLPAPSLPVKVAGERREPCKTRTMATLDQPHARAHTDRPAIRITGLTKRFRHVVAVDRLNLSIMGGDIFALLGANGSGKSTTFRLLLNIYKPSEGHAEVLGIRTTELNGLDFDQIGFISEGQKLPRWMQVGQWLQFCRGLYTGWDDTLCNTLMNEFGIHSKQRIKHLSRGQCMKICLASILPARPKLLLLDEPFSGLDVETRARLSQLLKELAHTSDLAIVLATHDVEEVEPVANRLGILDRGKLRVNEPIGDYIQRHRLCKIRKESFAALPAEMQRRFTPLRSEIPYSTYLTETFSEELVAEIKAATPADEAPEFTRMTLRQILSAHAGVPP